MLLLELQRLLASHEINSNARQKSCFFSVKRKHKVSDCWQIILFQKTEFQKRKETSFGFMSTLICKLTLIFFNLRSGITDLNAIEWAKYRKLSFVAILSSKAPWKCSFLWRAFSKKSAYCTVLSYLRTWTAKHAYYIS